MQNKLTKAARSIQPAPLAVLWLAAQIGISRFRDQGLLLTDVLEFVSGAIFFTLAILWPLLIKLSLYPTRQWNFSQAFFLVGGSVAFGISVVLIGAKLLYGFDYNAFFASGGAGAATFVFIFCMTFVIYAGLYPLSTGDDTDLIYKIGHSLKFMVLLMLFPIGVFFVTKHFKTLQQAT